MAKIEEILIKGQSTETFWSLIVLPSRNVLKLHSELILKLNQSYLNRGVRQLGHVEGEILMIGAYYCDVATVNDLFEVFASLENNC
jgi:hypothetical protein